MIDVTNLENFQPTSTNLEELLLFCVAVANQPAAEVATNLHNFLTCYPANGQHFCFRHRLTPFQKVALLAREGLLDEALKVSHLGPFKRVARGFRQTITVNPYTVGLEGLQRIHGIGPKASRLFLIYGRGRRDLVILDTHILGWMAAVGYPTVKGTPRDERVYLALEDAFVKEARFLGFTPLELDRHILLRGGRVLSALAS